MLVFPTKWGGLERWSGGKKKKRKERKEVAQVWRGSSRLASCTSVFLGTSRIMCLYACTRVILFAQWVLSTVTTSGRIWQVNDSKRRERSAVIRCACSNTPKHNPIDPHKHTLVWDMCKLTCVWPKAKVTGAGFPDVSYYPCSTEETFLVTLLSVSQCSDSRKEGQKGDELIGHRIPRNWTGFTETSWSLW